MKLIKQENARCIYNSSYKGVWSVIYDLLNPGENM